MIVSVQFCLMVLVFFLVCLFWFLLVDWFGFVGIFLVCFETRSHLVDQAGLELVEILLPLLPECRD